MTSELNATHPSSNFAAYVGVVSIWIGLLALMATGIYVITLLDLPRQGIAALATLWVLSLAAIGNETDKWWQKRRCNNETGITGGDD